MSPTQRLQGALHEEQAHRAALEAGIRDLLAHLSSAKFVGLEQDGERRDWIATTDVDRRLQVTLHEGVQARDLEARYRWAILPAADCVERLRRAAAGDRPGSGAGTAARDEPAGLRGMADREPAGPHGAHPPARGGIGPAPERWCAECQAEGERLMIRQYQASPSRGGPNPLRVGVIAVGSVYYIQDEGFFQDRYGTAAVCREPWIVEAFLNGTLAAACRSPATGQWKDRFMSGRSDRAVVRSLRDGRRKTVSVRMLVVHDEQGLSKLPTAYPDLPDVERFYRRRGPVMPNGGGRMGQRYLGGGKNWMAGKGSRDLPVPTHPSCVLV